MEDWLQVRLHKPRLTNQMIFILIFRFMSQFVLVPSFDDATGLTFCSVLLLQSNMAIHLNNLQNAEYMIAPSRDQCS